MNERIEYISNVASAYAETYANKHDGMWFQKYNEKFAELILRECKLFCGHDSEGVSAMFKHFGVEE